MNIPERFDIHIHSDSETVERRFTAILNALSLINAKLDALKPDKELIKALEQRAAALEALTPKPNP